RQSAPPFTAVSRTISSAGSFNRGLQRNRNATGSITAASASSSSFISSALRPVSFKMLAQRQDGFKLEHEWNRNPQVIRRSSAAGNRWRDAPQSLRIAATTTSASSTSRIDIQGNCYYMQYRLRFTQKGRRRS